MHQLSSRSEAALTYNNAAVAGQIAGSLNSAPVREISPVTEMGQAHDRLREFSMRFHDVVQRLVGSGYMQMEKGCGVNSPKNPSLPGLMDALQETAMEQHQLITTMNNGLDALIRRLP